MARERVRFVALESSAKAISREESGTDFDGTAMRVKELLLVIAVVALAASLFGRPPAKTPVPALSPTPEPEVSRWTVHGVSPADSMEYLTQLFGTPIRDGRDETSRFTVFSTPRGELRRVEFFEEGTVSLSGSEGELRGQGQVLEGMRIEQLQFLGKPTQTRGDKDWTSQTYPGVEIYFRDGKVFGVVAYASPPAP